MWASVPFNIPPFAQEVPSSETLPTSESLSESGIGCASALAAGPPPDKRMVAPRGVITSVITSMTRRGPSSTRSRSPVLSRVRDWWCTAQKRSCRFAWDGIEVLGGAPW